MAENLSLRQFSYLHRVLTQGWELGIRSVAVPRFSPIPQPGSLRHSDEGSLVSFQIHGMPLSSSQVSCTCVF